jgi:phospholipase/lecithinase/hemolysin
MKRTFAFALCFSLLVFTSIAFAEADFTDAVSFGNSLTHNDLLWIYYGNPPDLYQADPFEAVFNKGALPGDELANYAIAGSESGDVSSQIDLYEFFRLIGAQDKATLISFEIGGNDVLNNVGLLAAHAPGENAEADAITNALIDNMIADFSRLLGSHSDAQFVVWTVPDVTLTPDLWYDLAPDEAANVRAHIERVNRLIRKAGERFSYAVAPDVYTMMGIAVENPPVIFGHELVPPPAYGDYDNLFADEIHPTAVGNALIANYFILLMNAKWADSIPLYTRAQLADLAHIPH